jgi:hypothetical protein
MRSRAAASISTVFQVLQVNSPVKRWHLIYSARMSCAGRLCMLWTVFAIVLLLWFLGWGFHVAGSLIHLLLVVALVIFLIEIITGRKATV